MVDANIRDYQNRIVIQELVTKNGLDIATAAKLWYNSETKKGIQDCEEDLNHVYPMQCYTRLIMEVEKDPLWEFYMVAFE